MHGKTQFLKFPDMLLFMLSLAASVLSSVHYFFLCLHMIRGGEGGARKTLSRMVSSSAGTSR